MTVQEADRQYWAANDSYIRARTDKQTARRALTATERVGIPAEVLTATETYHRAAQDALAALMIKDAAYKAVAAAVKRRDDDLAAVVAKENGEVVRPAKTQ